MNQPDEKDDLWRLLGQARTPKVSPFFAHNIVRELRNMERERPGLLDGLRRRWQFVLSVAGTACVIALAAWQFLGGDLRNSQSEQLAAIVRQVSDSPDYDVIRDLDELLAWEESSVWLDNPSN